MMITTTKELKAVCSRFAKHPFMTVDTEFIREKTYYPQVCLIQIASPEEAFCVDPLAEGLSLEPLFQLFVNKDVIKVFHACRQDIEIFYHLNSQIPVPVFDTQVGAMVCGYGDNVSYSQLVHDFVGVSLDKTMRITDWAHRPLTPEQIEYALHDVIELRDVYTKMMARICESNRLDWLSEEMLNLITPETYQVDPVKAWQKIKVPFKNPLMLHVFARLCAWRERSAQAKNRPRKHILKDEALIELAIAHPKDVSALDHLRAFSEGFSKSDVAAELIQVVQQALADDPAEFERLAVSKPLTTAEKNMCEFLRLVLSAVCDEHCVAPKLIASTDEINAFIQTQQASFLTGWRHQIFGKYALLAIKGQLKLAYSPELGRLTLQTK
ncbi:MAG: ribonuclease D [Alphaproteobacteria bacterium]|nr:ribonuclease D [Alphaproteobacteria bacterium]